MTTRQKLTIVAKRFHFSFGLFLLMTMSGIFCHSYVLGIGGAIGVIVSVIRLNRQMRCPLCKTPLFIDYPRMRHHINFCPGCARSLDFVELDT